MDGGGDYNYSVIKIFLALVLKSLCNDFFKKISSGESWGGRISC